MDKFSFENYDIIKAVKSAESGFLTTKQKRTNIEIVTCSLRTESILAKIDERPPNKCFVCSIEETKAHVYHVMASSPIVFDVWPQVFHNMLHCTGRRLTINDPLIFNNRV